MSHASVSHTLSLSFWQPFVFRPTKFAEARLLENPRRAEGSKNRQGKRRHYYNGDKKLRCKNKRTTRSSKQKHQRPQTSCRYLPRRAPSPPLSSLLYNSAVSHRLRALWPLLCSFSGWGRALRQNAPYIVEKRPWSDGMSYRDPVCRFYWQSRTVQSVSARPITRSVLCVGCFEWHEILDSEIIRRDTECKLDATPSSTPSISALCSTNYGGPYQKSCPTAFYALIHT